MNKEPGTIKFVYRNKLSGPAKRALKIAKENKVQTILDYGCGKSLDVYCFRKLGFHSIGWDKYFTGKYIIDSLEPFSKGVFDMVTCFYVLHVIPDIETRLQVLNDIKKVLRPGGLAIIAVDYQCQISNRAKTGNWKIYKDGYITKRDHFYKGFTKEELLSHVPLNDFEIIRTYREPLIAVLKRKVNNETNFRN